MDAVLALAMSAEFARVLGVDLEEAMRVLTDLDAEGGRFDIGSKEYSLLSDSGADAQCREQILNNLCNLRPSSLASCADVPVKAMEAIQDTESNDAVSRFLERLGVLDDVINDAIALDGRGHFLSEYDGSETPVGRFYLYRHN